MRDDDWVYNNLVFPPEPRRPNTMVDKQDYIDGLAAVKEMIADDFDGVSASTPKYVLLIGHPIVPYSGSQNGTAHESAAAPTDLYFADLDATPMTWGDSLTLVPNGNDGAHEATTNEPGDSRFDVNAVPTDGDSERVEINIGRIDMANLDAAFPTSETYVEFESRLINQYLERNYAWRTAAWDASEALIDPISERDQHANTLEAQLESLVGEGNVVRDDERTWLSEFEQSTPTRYLFASAAYRGDYDAVANDYEGALEYPQFTSYHFEDTPVQAVFTTVYGSYMSDWNNRSLRAFVGDPNFTDEHGNGTFPTVAGHLMVSNLMRSILGAEGDALVSTLHPGSNFWAGAGFFLGSAPLSLGYTAGEGYRHGLNQLNGGAAFSALLGDPTIRASYVKPVANGTIQNPTPITATVDLTTGYVTIDWEASPDDIASNGFVGYKIYQSSSLTGTFSLAGTITGQGQTTAFTDQTPAGEYVYMVRAIKNTTTPAGTYENASTGVFASHVTFTGTTGADALVLTRSLDAEPTMHATFNGTDDYGLDARIVEHIEFVGGNGDDTLTVNLAPASTIPAGGIEYTGNAGDDTLIVLGSAADDVVAFDETTVMANDGLITLNDMVAYQFDGNGGGDDLAVADDVTVKFLDAQDLAALDLNTTGTIDLDEFDLVIRDATYAAVRDAIVGARNGGAWDEPGITSSAAEAQTNHATMLGVLTGSQYISVNGTSFNGFTVTSADVLVKYTWYGDADFSGTVTFDDYSRIQSGYGNGTSWFQGDFDLNGVVNFDDYAKIDLGFGVQSGQLFGGPTPWQQIAQMDHFDQQYMYHLIDELEKHGIYLTAEDFLVA